MNKQIRTVIGYRETWDKWVYNETLGYTMVVELGAGLFERLVYIDNNVRKLGIEIFLPYIDNAAYKNCEKIHGDMRHYGCLVRHLLSGTKVAMLIDSLEHLTREEAFKLIKELKTDFDKIVLMIPRGNCTQDEDNTGYDNEYQKHKSFWFDDDLIELGMTDISIDNNFHIELEDQGCYFATWEK